MAFFIVNFPLLYPLNSVLWYLILYQAFLGLKMIFNIGIVFMLYFHYLIQTIFS